MILFLIDREHQNTHADQISASFNNKCGFYKETKENNRKIRAQMKKSLFLTLFVILFVWSIEDVEAQLRLHITSHMNYHGKTIGTNKSLKQHFICLIFRILVVTVYVRLLRR